MSSPQPCGHPQPRRGEPRRSAYQFRPDSVPRTPVDLGTWTVDYTTYYTGPLGTHYTCSHSQFTLTVRYSVPVRRFARYRRNKACPGVFRRLRYPPRNFLHPPLPCIGPMTSPSSLLNENSRAETTTSDRGDRAKIGPRDAPLGAILESVRRVRPHHGRF